MVPLGVTPRGLLSKTMFYFLINPILKHLKIKYQTCGSKVTEMYFFSTASRGPYGTYLVHLQTESYSVGVENLPNTYPTFTQHFSKCIWRLGICYISQHSLNFNTHKIQNLLPNIYPTFLNHYIAVIVG